MGKIGFIQDLLHGIPKVLSPTRQKAENAAAPAAASNSVEKWLKRAAIFIQDGNWDSATEYCERVLDEDPENAEACFDQCLIEHRLQGKEALLQSDVNLTVDHHFRNALRFAPEKYQAVVKEQQETKKECRYRQAEERIRQGEYDAAAAIFRSLGCSIFI